VLTEHTLCIDNVDIEHATCVDFSHPHFITHIYARHIGNLCQSKDMKVKCQYHYQCGSELGSFISSKFFDVDWE